MSPVERQRLTDLLQRMDTSVGASSIAQFVHDHKLSWDHLQPSHKRLASFLGMLDSNQVGERQNAGRLAVKYIKERGLSFDDVIGPDLAKAKWEPEPEPEAAAWEPEPEPEAAAWEPEPDDTWPIHEQPVDLDETAWKPREEAPKTASESDGDEVPAAKAPPDWDALTTTQQVIFGTLMIAVTISAIFATKWFWKHVLSPTQGTVLACIILAVVAVRWVVKRVS